ncbi:dTDP-4-dehydrorhamnose reductase [Paenibacillus mucilaginosus 3016]|uniref:dTDP-4-dehydrorhamnose reductase n=1 Tax=Paenibacillus mucilaginosus 3016 TaxID=1116391 RepID=H6NSY1_9BACL|nr:dTDP-4-dehydrorhamnose reductase [Paenibacillus mucilaginosus]AFC27522.1 dTDP-4-dehydrorhamnose reductase [Paenibacillus mucilaginosus 3016]WFA16419.1 dTDP-4-dehydrorhamnose reductase [Paenibacillus mucilaginosus]
MKVLVTGANGQLGQDVATLFAEQHEVRGLGRAQLDITNLEQCLEQVESFRPDVIIHCAAYTAVDQAESDVDGAYLVNAVGTRNMAAAAEKVGSKLCYISTDYVFDGKGTSPYREYDKTNPSGIYGKSKEAGEQLAMSLCSRYFIVRTSWVYGLHGNNFVKTMLKLSEDRDRLKVVHDQIGSPTFTEDLAGFLLALVNTEKYGIYHASNSGICSWYEFAKAIFEESGKATIVEPCTTDEFPRPAPRPSYSVMDHLSIRTNGFNEIRPWREALIDFLQKYGQVKA